MILVPRVIDLLSEQQIDDVTLTVGGTIPSDDIPELKRLGVAEVFTPERRPTASSNSSWRPVAEGNATRRRGQRRKLRPAVSGRYGLVT
jgi:hypothetical protein